MQTLMSRGTGAGVSAPHTIPAARVLSDPACYNMILSSSAAKRARPGNDGTIVVPVDIEQAMLLARPGAGRRSPGSGVVGQGSGVRGAGSALGSSVASRHGDGSSVGASTYTSRTGAEGRADGCPAGTASSDGIRNGVARNDHTANSGRGGSSSSGRGGSSSSIRLEELEAILSGGSAGVAGAAGRTNGRLGHAGHAVGATAAREKWRLGRGVALSPGGGKGHALLPSSGRALSCGRGGALSPGSSKGRVLSPGRAHALSPGSGRGRPLSPAVGSVRALSPGRGRAGSGRGRASSPVIPGKRAMASPQASSVGSAYGGSYAAQHQQHRGARSASPGCSPQVRPSTNPPPARTPSGWRSYALVSQPDSWSGKALPGRDSGGSYASIAAAGLEQDRGQPAVALPCAARPSSSRPSTALSGSVALSKLESRLQGLQARRKLLEGDGCQSAMWHSDGTAAAPPHFGGRDPNLQGQGQSRGPANPSWFSSCLEGRSLGTQGGLGYTGHCGPSQPTSASQQAAHKQASMASTTPVQAWTGSTSPDQAWRGWQQGLSLGPFSPLGPSVQLHTTRDNAPGAADLGVVRTPLRSGMSADAAWQLGEEASFGQALQPALDTGPYKGYTRMPGLGGWGLANPKPQTSGSSVSGSVSLADLSLPTPGPAMRVGHGGTGVHAGSWAGRREGCSAMKKVQGVGAAAAAGGRSGAGERGGEAGQGQAGEGAAAEPEVQVLGRFARPTSAGELLYQELRAQAETSAARARAAISAGMDAGQGLGAQGRPGEAGEGMLTGAGAWLAGAGEGWGAGHERNSLRWSLDALRGYGPGHGALRDHLAGGEEDELHRGADAAAAAAAASWQLPDDADSAQQPALEPGSSQPSVSGSVTALEANGKLEQSPGGEGHGGMREELLRGANAALLGVLEREREDAVALRV